VQQRLSGWGRYPFVDAECSQPGERAEARAVLSHGPALIPYGLGRSYGDSALGPRVVQSARLDKFLAFDPATGVLKAQAGVSLDEILRVFVPQGWFVYGTPGTKFVTLGGAVASDVHGKGHHSEGCFSQALVGFNLMLADGEIRHCSPTENAALFHATCGGMGLTGLILDVSVRLKPIRSAFIRQTTYKAASLDQAFEDVEATASAPYSVAWVDCLATGKSLGRSILTVGDFMDDGDLRPHRGPKLSVPELPITMAQPWTNRAFNECVYHLNLKSRGDVNRVHYQKFFYPLDVVNDWNRLYGKGGFTQHQFVIPKAAGLKGMRPLLEMIAQSGKGSALAVLKATGPANANLLSFPIEGYSLALDFKLEDGLFDLLDELDARVLGLGGRMYLTKDVHMSAATFQKSYPRWQDFQKIRQDAGAIGRFASLQSQRIGLD
jgi:FAD/FMN-containing dehydrogenase